MSAPATNALSPPPVRITTRISSEISSSPARCVNSAMTFDDSAFTGGRSIVTIASAPSIETFNVSKPS
jgi:hypothetical protein